MNTDRGAVVGGAQCVSASILSAAKYEMSLSCVYPVFI